MYTIFFLIFVLSGLYVCVAVSFKRIIGSHPNISLYAEDLTEHKIEEISFVTSPYKCGMLCFKQKCKMYSFNEADNRCTTYDSKLKIPMPTENLQVFIETGNGSCNEGWSQYGKKCFILITTPANWGYSQVHCRNFSGFLAHASEEGVNEFLKGIARKHGSSVRIGGFKSQGEWKWDGNNKPVTFTDWSPSNPSGAGQCIMLWNGENWGWDDHYCDTKIAFFCELPSS